MKRGEEIRQYLKERNIPITSLEANSIIEGAKWADETMIDKACEWLENNINNYIIIDDYLGKVQHKISSSMFDNFKKAMGL